MSTTDSVFSLSVQIVAPMEPGKPLQPDNKKHPDEDDFSVTSSYLISN